MSINVAQASLAYSMNNFEETYELLKNDNMSRPKVLSMLGGSSFFTGRFEESYKYYHRLFDEPNSIYLNELGCPIEKFDPEGQSIYDFLKNLDIENLDMPVYSKNKNYKQSIERPDETYEELDELNNILKDRSSEGKKKFGIFMERMIDDSSSLNREKRANAYFNLGEIYFLNQDYVSASRYYAEAAHNEPNKALFYGFAGQALLRDKESNPVLICIFLRRAIDLDLFNAKWHLLQGLALHRLVNVSPYFKSSAKYELERAEEYCRNDQYSLKKAIQDYLEKFDLLF